MKDDRKEYRDGGEVIVEDPNEPLGLLSRWIREATERGVVEPNSMSLATVDESGAPRSRMVLLKFLEGEEIGFFTNMESDKSLEIKSTPSVSATIWWPEMERQVRMEGTAYEMKRHQVEEYHSSRPRKSRIAAWASNQSRSLESRADLLRKFEETECEFEGTEVPLPPFWGGFRIIVERVEYWSGRPSRLHERVVLTRAGDSWKLSRLYP
ncbi:MAG: pyridoxamine 5'-phosphate oxidase [Candidatus Thalassarchaeaceae archaeon]|jgi:pyridoxamine 5'-phosphate oxidase|nr:pyridoxamine 5'-phosphate oxidase [Candidatus Thalassarchaeaceae archaeon]|tara:strand:+ start:81 stop:710 length:630 start_codon:yes stop_codon:yes gene_type:complete